MVITGERSYHNVVSVAELAPDDYLIKPFTADQLQARLLKAVVKKFLRAGLSQARRRRLHRGAERLRRAAGEYFAVRTRRTAAEGRDSQCTWSP